jgi:hypothetical protein
MDPATKGLRSIHGRRRRINKKAHNIMGLSVFVGGEGVCQVPVNLRSFT